MCQLVLGASWGCAMGGCAAAGPGQHTPGAAGSRRAVSGSVCPSLRHFEVTGMNAREEALRVKVTL